MCQNDTCEDTRGPLAVADTFTAQIKVRKKKRKKAILFVAVERKFYENDYDNDNSESK